MTLALPALALLLAASAPASRATPVREATRAPAAATDSASAAAGNEATPSVPADEAPAATPAAPEPPPPPPPPGAVSGVVRHAGRTPLRVKTLTNTVDADACGGTVRLQAVLLGRDNALANVVVELRRPASELGPEDAVADAADEDEAERSTDSDGDPDGAADPAETWRPEPTTLEVSLRACSSEPHVAILAPGTHVEIVNPDHLHHELVTQARRNVVWEQRLPRYARRVEVPARAVARPEAVRLGCERHPFMSAWWWITDNPRHALTAADGAFSFRDVPPGRWIVHAWHEELGEVEQVVDVAPGQALRVDLAYR